MREAEQKQEMIRALKQQMALLEGFKPPAEARSLTGLEVLAAAFPGSRFPTGVVHEFISHQPHEAAATHGFIAAVAGLLMQQQALCVWISRRSQVFAAGLRLFCPHPERVVFIEARTEKELLWTTEEALGCRAVGAVVADLQELGFTESRRLQLAVERSGVTAFIHRHQPRGNQAVACHARWQIRPLQSETESGMPGPGFPRWEVALLKLRNGRPAQWQIEWTPGGFTVPKPVAQEVLVIPQRKIV